MLKKNLPRVIYHQVPSQRHISPISGPGFQGKVLEHVELFPLLSVAVYS